MELRYSAILFSSDRGKRALLLASFLNHGMAGNGFLTEGEGSLGAEHSSTGVQVVC